MPSNCSPCEGTVISVEDAGRAESAIGSTQMAEGVVWAKAGAVRSARSTTRRNCRLRAKGHRCAFGPPWAILNASLMFGMDKSRMSKHQLLCRAISTYPFFRFLSSALDTCCTRHLERGSKFRRALRAVEASLPAIPGQLCGTWRRRRALLRSRTTIRRAKFRRSLTGICRNAATLFAFAL